MADTGKIIALAKAMMNPAAIESAVSDWLDDHPEATTTVEDGAISYDKLDSSLQGTVDDVPALKSALSSVENDIYEIEPVTGHFNFTGGSSALSNVQLTSGVEYTITNTTSGVSGGLLYIDGHSSPSKSFPAVNDSVKFTPSDTGYLKLYNDGIASGTDVTFTAIGTDVFAKVSIVEELQTSVSEIKNTLENMDAPTVYEVGTGKQYTSFVDCINALPVTGSKVVYVYPGEYDIYDEMGGDDFVSSLSASSNWYDVNPIIPPNTKIIGIGRVLFKYNCPDNIDSGKAVLLSCLNIRGSASVENINIECKNLRYAIHVEGSANANFDFSDYIIKNCSMIRADGTYENAVIGIGLNAGCEITIEGCTVKSETTHGNSLLIHGNTESLTNSVKMTIRDCVMLDNYMTLQLMCRYNSNAVIPVNVYNSYLQTLIYKTTGSGQQCNDEFSVTLVGCNNVPVNNGSSISNLRTVYRYNTIGS